MIRRPNQDGHKKFSTALGRYTKSFNITTPREYLAMHASLQIKVNVKTNIIAHIFMTGCEPLVIAVLTTASR